MLTRTPTETRLAYLLRVSIAYLREHGDNTIDYDGTDCDGYCLADDLQTELDGLPDHQEPCTPETHAKPIEYRFLTEGEQVMQGDEREVRPGCWLAADPWEPPASAAKPRIVTAYEAGREKYRRVIGNTAKMERLPMTGETRRAFCTCDDTGTPDHQHMSRQTCPVHGF